MTESKDKYPQHTKLKSVLTESRTIGSFLDWLFNERTPKTLICTQESGDNYPTSDSTAGIEPLLAEYFGIDRTELSREKDLMYQELVEATQCQE